MSTGAGKRKSVEAIEAELAEGKIEAHRVARKLFYHTGDFQTAMTYARKVYRERPRALELEEIGNLYLQSGNEFAARNTYLSCMMLYGHLHTTNLLVADIPVARAFVDHEHKIVYMPIPKNASSTIKNYISFGLSGETHKEAVHRKMLKNYRYVTPEDLATRYKDYFKFAVVRDPVDRVSSFFSRNISTGAIKRSSYGLKKFRNLPTLPSAQEFVENFDNYRRFFLGTRHHTDRQVKYFNGFLGEEVGLNIFGMGGVPTIRAKLSECFGREIADERFMVTDKKKEEKKKDPVWEELREHFKRDMAVFAPVIEKTGDVTQPYAIEAKKAPRPSYFNSQVARMGDVADEALSGDDADGEDQD